MKSALRFLLLCVISATAIATRAKPKRIRAGYKGDVAIAKDLDIF